MVSTTVTCSEFLCQDYLTLGDTPVYHTMPTNAQLSDVSSAQSAMLHLCINQLMGYSCPPKISQNRSFCVAEDNEMMWWWELCI